MSVPNKLERFLVGRSFTIGNKTCTIDYVDDFQPQERSIGISAAYAACGDNSGNTLIIFEHGEVQTEDGKVLGVFDNLNYQELYSD